ncbi:gp43 [Burkholderia pseudomallei]|uniref:hypothetical protein n=1 Tax=Burkholderia pseudomallei TaxID=28450 RepID=UPI000F1FFDA2|nr:hypothetical protein [Burkholderia pseudomallei]CAJ5402619.1 gp43 [Burkholderia pseudomallei]VBJ42268.1 gp43 [Burkholderia pseudomallei]
MTTTDKSRADALTERDYDLHEHEQGLYRKFDVRRVDGSSEPGGKHHDCEYFVLDMTHDQHARAALRAYADACASTHPELSADLIARYALAPIEQPAAAPIPMLLFCPRCGTQHIDRPEVHSEADASIGQQIKEVVTWDNPPHRSHLCHACGIVWRPADVATVGVKSIETRGNADTWTDSTPWIGHNRPAPSPADERAAFVERVMGMFEAWPKGKPGPTDEPESHYRFGYNTALEDVLTALDVGSPTRRAASANETGADGAKTEAEIRKTMTPEQIRLERNLTCEAIDGAMSFGYQNTNPPPSADHWLAPFWKIGRKQYAAEFALHYLDDQLTEYLKGMPADETSRNLRDIARNALVDIEAAPRSPAMAAEALAEEHSTIECQAHSGPDCTECGGTGVWSGKADERAASWHCEDPVQKCRAQCDSCAKQARAATEIADERAVSFEAWCDRFPEISAVERLRDAWQEARAALPEDRIDWIANTHCPGGTAYPVNVKNAIREALREARISDNDTGAEAVAIPQSVINALRFYANGHHFNIDENHQQFDTVSGEPQNWLCSERDDDCTMIEDGSIAKAALCGGVLGFEESEKPIEGEVFTAAQQPAQADARVGLTAAARATIMDACQSISRNADGVKAGCAIGDEWPDAEDKAFYDAELQLLARLVALLNDSGQSEPETATVARIEQLRKALFESRDAMRVMSNWAKKPDPAGHSWAVRMVDRANAALNGEPEPRAEVTGGDELKARRLIRYGECRCILTQYCDGMCNPIYEDDARTGASS